MDAELRRRFLRCLEWDFTALDMRAEGIVNPTTGKTGWELGGGAHFERTRKWWLEAVS